MRLWYQGFQSPLLLQLHSWDLKPACRLAFRRHIWLRIFYIPNKRHVRAIHSYINPPRFQKILCEPTTVYPHYYPGIWQELVGLLKQSDIFKSLGPKVSNTFVSSVHTDTFAHSYLELAILQKSYGRLVVKRSVSESVERNEHRADPGEWKFYLRGCVNRCEHCVNPAEIYPRIPVSDLWHIQLELYAGPLLGWSTSRLF